MSFAGLQYPTPPLNDNADSDELQRKLRRVRPSRAQMMSTSVHLVDVTADPDAKTTTWTTPLAEMALGAGSNQAQRTE